MFCQNCGVELADEAKFCPSCGKQVNTAAAQPAAPQPAAAPQAPVAPQPPAAPQAPAAPQVAAAPQVPAAPQQPAAYAQSAPTAATITEPGQIYPMTDTDRTLRLINFILCILSTVALCWTVISLAWMIPMTVHSWKIYKGQKPNTTAFGVCTLIFITMIGGILLLVSKKDNQPAA